MKSPGKRLRCQFFSESLIFSQTFTVYMMYMQNMFWVMCGFRFWVWSFTTFVKADAIVAARQALASIGWSDKHATISVGMKIVDTNLNVETL